MNPALLALAAILITVQAGTIWWAARMQRRLRAVEATAMIVALDPLAPPVTDPARQWIESGGLIGTPPDADAFLADLARNAGRPTVAPHLPAGDRLPSQGRRRWVALLWRLPSVITIGVAAYLTAYQWGRSRFTIIATILLTAAVLVAVIELLRWHRSLRPRRTPTLKPEDL